MSAIITIFARKGGVGRTTLIQCLAGACAEYYRVLVVDTDNQANLSKRFFGVSTVESFRPYETIAAVFDLDAGANAEEVIHQTDIPGVSMLPASDHFLSLDRPVTDDDDELVFALRDFLREAESDFDIILVDTPPNVYNLPAHAALLACDGVITSVVPHVSACEAVIDAKRMLSKVIVEYNHDLIDLGYVINNHNARRATEKAHIEQVRRIYGPQVFNTKIMARVAFSETAIKRMPITHMAPRSEEAEMIRKLFAEIVQKMMEHNQRTQMAYEEEDATENQQTKGVGNG